MELENPQFGSTDILLKPPRVLLAASGPYYGASPDGANSQMSSQPDNTNSSAAITVAQFVAGKFLPEHIASKTTPGRRHYQAILKHVLTPSEVDLMFAPEDPGAKAKLKADPHWPYLGHYPLAAVTKEDVERLIAAATHKGYSAQTVKHIRNVVRAIFSHAIRDRFFQGENPATGVALPDMIRRESHSLSITQAVQLLERMQYPEREIALMAILTTMSIAEICGLQWMYVNLTDRFLTREDVLIPPRSIAVRYQWYRGELSEVPAARKKDIRISPLLLRVLRHLASTRRVGWHDFVLATKSGRPINQVNLAARRLKRIGRQLGMLWISWQVIRRTRQSIFYEYEARVQDQLAQVIFPGSTWRVTPP